MQPRPADGKREIRYGKHWSRCQTCTQQKKCEDSPTAIAIQGILDYRCRANSLLQT